MNPFSIKKCFCSKLQILKSVLQEQELEDKDAVTTLFAEILKTLTLVIVSIVLMTFTNDQHKKKQCLTSSPAHCQQTVLYGISLGLGQSAGFREAVDTLQKPIHQPGPLR